MQKTTTFLQTSGRKSRGALTARLLPALALTALTAAARASAAACAAGNEIETTGSGGGSSSGGEGGDGGGGTVCKAGAEETCYSGVAGTADDDEQGGR